MSLNELTEAQRREIYRSLAQTLDYGLTAGQWGSAVAARGSPRINRSRTFRCRSSAPRSADR
jgi:hypothetical protein